MDEYPAASLDHNVPLLAVSGLTTAPTKPLLTSPELKEQGILIRSEAPLIDTREAKTILQYIQSIDTSHLPSNPGDGSRKYRFKVKTVGREFLLPPRRARLPDDVENPPSPAVLHSPFSPLSPGSSLYPDGLIDAQWLIKHQEFLPSVCLLFYQLSSDSTLSTLHDNQLKTDINTVKNALVQSGYKCRPAVVILCDHNPSGMSQFQERLELIRRGTGLDPKASLFVLPTQRSEADLETALDNVLTAVFEQAAEYYRDLARHTRKKRSRGIIPQPTVPPTSGTSHTLSLQGWNLRYDFKTAVFAEFRQEMDIALRSYEQAYETLLGADVLETIPSWSPRFNDARLLADTVAIRILRCLLWIGQSTSAVRRWQSHRDRMADFIDRRGRGTENYGWKAFESRWAVVMGQLVEQAQFPEFETSSVVVSRPPEKTLSADRLQPWEVLHHQGYWYRIAARHLLDRRRFAQSIPEDDRQPPAASTTAKPSYHYDSYMCPEPWEEYPAAGNGTNHAQLILDLLTIARTEYQKRRQLRIAAELVLDCCWELETMKGWWDITEAMGWALRSAAVHLGQGDLVLAIDWELMDRSFSRRPNWHYDITRSLADLTTKSQPVVTISDDLISSFLTASFAFKNAEGKAGQPCPAQISLRSNAFPGSPAITLKSIRIEFDGSLRTIELQHLPDEPPPSTNVSKINVSRVTLAEKGIGDDRTSDDEDSASEGETSPTDLLEGKSNLTISPGSIRVFEIDIPLREPGDAKATKLQVSVAPESFTLNYSIQLEGDSTVGTWYSPSASKKVLRTSSQQIHVLPRPPKMELKFVKLHQQYYTNESIQLELEMHNEEESDANVKLDVVITGTAIPGYQVQTERSREQSSVTGQDTSRLVGIPVGQVAAAKVSTASIIFEPVGRPREYEVITRVLYYLVSDPATPIIQQTRYQLDIVTPFEANFDLLPKLHSHWPSLFDYEGIQDTLNDGESTARPLGLAQRWTLVTRYASFATEDLKVADLSVNVSSTQGGVVCTASREQTDSKSNITISPKTIEEAHFDIVAQKLSLDDRAPSTADLSFSVNWQRLGPEDSPVNTTTLPLPRFFVTVAEPRVLASVSYSSEPGVPPLVFLDITIENPSSHFLTFGLTMEPSDSFAFSGAKTTTINVLPVARRSTTYRLLPLIRGAWIRPTLVVRDKYFQKVLRIIPTEGMKSDKEGVLLWVPPDEDEETESEADAESS